MNDAPLKFWNFSLAVYAQPEVPKACLWLQDERGADINLVLFCLWAGAVGIPLREPVMQSALRFSERWAGEVIHPLRAVRRWMKQDKALSTIADVDGMLALRERVKAVELAAEQQQQMQLETLLNPSLVTGIERPETAASGNIVAYFEHLNLVLDDEFIQRLDIVAAAVAQVVVDFDAQAFARELQRANAREPR